MGIFQSIGEIRGCPALNLNHWSHNAQPHYRTFRSGFLRRRTRKDGGWRVTCTTAPARH